MNADTTADVTDMYVDIDFNKPIAVMTDGMSLETQQEISKVQAVFKSAQQARNVQRYPFGQSCAVAPIVRMDKLMGEVVEKAARRVARDMIKDQCAYEINLLVAAEYCKNGDWEKSVAYGEHLIDQMLDEAMKTVLEKVSRNE